MPRPIESCTTRTKFAMATLEQWLMVSICLFDDLKVQNKNAIKFIENFTNDLESNPLLASIFLSNGKPGLAPKKNMVDFYQANYCLDDSLDASAHKFLIKIENALILYVQQLTDDHRLPGTDGEPKYSLEFLTWVSRCFNLNDKRESMSMDKGMKASLLAFCEDSCDKKRTNILDIAFFAIENSKKESNNAPFLNYEYHLNRILFSYLDDFNAILKSEQYDLEFCRDLTDKLSTFLDGKSKNYFNSYISNNTFSSSNLQNAAISDSVYKLLLNKTMKHLLLYNTQENIDFINNNTILNVIKRKRAGRLV